MILIVREQYLEVLRDGEWGGVFYASDGLTWP